jgi:prolyl-tRNA synthetase
MGNRLTPRDQDFAKWYTEVCDLAKLFTYGDTKGTINYLPNS